MKQLKSVPVFKIVAESVTRFNRDKCWTSSIVISYFALLCAVPLVALFAFVSAKVLGSSELAIRSLNLFSEDFFAKMDPSFLKRIQAVSTNVANLGWFGLGGSFVAGSFLFSSLISSINFIFKVNHRKSFFYNRLMEYIIMFTVGVIMFISLAITVIWAALHRSLQESKFVAEHINPSVMNVVDGVALQYIIPLALTFLVFFSLYKFIPEIKVHTKAAAKAALVGALLWEIFKRLFAFYVAHLSAVGVVLSKLVQGTLTSIIFFLLWISLSLVILLWGAELTAVLNERQDARLRAQAKTPA